MKKFESDSQATYSSDELANEINEKYNIEIFDSEKFFKLNKDAKISKGILFFSISL